MIGGQHLRKRSGTRVSNRRVVIKCQRLQCAVGIERLGKRTCLCIAKRVAAQPQLRSSTMHQSPQRDHIQTPSRHPPSQTPLSVWLDASALASAGAPGDPIEFPCKANLCSVLLTASILAIAVAPESPISLSSRLSCTEVPASQADNVHTIANSQAGHWSWGPHPPSRGCPQHRQ